MHYKNAHVYMYLCVYIILQKKSLRYDNKNLKNFSPVLLHKKPQDSFEIIKCSKFLAFRTLINLIMNEMK